MNEKYVQFVGYLIIFLFVGYTGCFNRDSSLHVTELSPEYFVTKYITLSKLCDDIKYIPLGSVPLIKNINKLEIADSLIFIATYPNGVLVYNHDGTFCRQIGKKGQGPGEYIRATSFALDNNNKRIYIKGAVNILVFDFKGNFIREIRRGHTLDFTNLEFKDGKLYGMNPVFNLKESNFFNWVVIDTLGKELLTKINTTTGFKENGMSAYGNISYKFDNFIYYWNHYNDTIFKLLDNAYETKFLFKNDKYRLTPEFAEDNNIMLGKKEKYIPRIIFESKNYLFMKYTQFNQTHIGIYDKITKIFEKNDVEINPHKGIINDIDGGMAFDPVGCLQWEGNEYLFATVNSYELIAHVNCAEFKNLTPVYSEKKEELERLANSLDENDNPVLMLVKLKD